MNTNFDDIRDPRSHQEIILVARRMRAEYLRELFGKLRAALAGTRGGQTASHGPVLSPSAR
ncbi:hypothetical protein VY88_00285 [Azospirillum thiophilum]|uniref:Uncharacterized protein n=1 Tax=Azospirillum thiophilum TaxID=528244 RepID=A0AAC8ZUD0_9PROT|nr:hypothetical protein [Azospirillum thiophilum]ALG71590.1 hypothetical protein AL072_12425 [Azospirillum thiophilum]KJR64763.1 hypothetical protein VY88_00285 [Azospirillum thiophilum]